MRFRSGLTFKGLIVALIIAAGIIAIGLYLKSTGQELPVPGGSNSGKTSGQTAKEPSVPLREFCADAELDAWFDKIEEDAPVRMRYIIFGYAPVEMEFTDRDLILRTVKALETVMIDGPSDENPDNVSDAGGDGYYFEMEDGSKKSFAFIMGCFQWNRGGYHDVTSYGELRKLNEELSRIGNPQLEYVYAPDSGFYTQMLETYTSAWIEEDGVGGGLYIYGGAEGEIPYVGICRCASTVDPGAFLAGELDQYMRAEVEKAGGVLAEEVKTETYSTFHKKDLPCALYTAEFPKEQGGTISFFNVVLKDKDDLLGDPCLIRFCAAYRGGDEKQKNKAMEMLRVAVDEFYYKHRIFEKKEVQPGNLLLDFINDDRIRAWVAGFEERPADFLFYTTKSWESIEDPEEIRKTLEALQTVRIGGLSDKHVGASGRRIYDFMYSESGESMQFEFFEDTFFWNGKSYDVVDWGKLGAK